MMVYDNMFYDLSAGAAIVQQLNAIRMSITSIAVSFALLGRF